MVEYDKMVGTHVLPSRGKLCAILLMVVQSRYSKLESGEQSMENGN